jgi:hypothetical protein
MASLLDTTLSMKTSEKYHETAKIVALHLEYELQYQTKNANEIKGPIRESGVSLFKSS